MRNYLHRRPRNHGSHNEEGIIITLVAIFMLAVVGAMAALAIDVVSFYDARSEAQLAADAAALAGARFLANSGMTSANDSALAGGLVGPCQNFAKRVAEANDVGGQTVVSAQVTATCDVSTLNHPIVTVQVQTTQPTFFARIWGTTTVLVSASATAEAYNAAGSANVSNPAVPVAPVCVKPWLLPNIDPTQTSRTGKQIFDPNTGQINTPGLVGQGWGTPISANKANGLRSRLYSSRPDPGRYYPGKLGSNPGEFTVPTQANPSCSTGFTDYQLAVAGCVPQPISCASQMNFDTGSYSSNPTTVDDETVTAAECLIHYNNAAGDSDYIAGEPTSATIPFEFVGGKQNPVSNAQGKDILVSDSIVTIPVYDIGTNTLPPSNPVTIIGFLQVFLNPQSLALPSPTTGQIPVIIINQIGCGTNAAGTPVYGNGPSAVPVRLITPPPAS